MHGSGSTSTRARCTGTAPCACRSSAGCARVGPAPPRPSRPSSAVQRRDELPPTPRGVMASWSRTTPRASRREQWWRAAHRSDGARAQRQRRRRDHDAGRRVPSAASPARTPTGCCASPTACLRCARALGPEWATPPTRATGRRRHRRAGAHPRPRHPRAGRRPSTTRRCRCPTAPSASSCSCRSCPPSRGSSVVNAVVEALRTVDPPGARRALGLFSSPRSSRRPARACRWSPSPVRPDHHGICGHDRRRGVRRDAPLRRRRPHRGPVVDRFGPGGWWRSSPASLAAAPVGAVPCAVRRRRAAPRRPVVLVATVARCALETSTPGHYRCPTRPEKAGMVTRATGLHRRHEPHGRHVRRAVAGVPSQSSVAPGRSSSSGVVPRRGRCCSGLPRIRPDPRRRGGCRLRRAAGVGAYVAELREGAPWCATRAHRHPRCSCSSRTCSTRPTAP